LFGRRKADADLRGHSFRCDDYIRP
jgi:hypothetical protein